jgi:hypothetical protein
MKIKKEKEGGGRIISVKLKGHWPYLLFHHRGDVKTIQILLHKAIFGH